MSVRPSYYEYCINVETYPIERAPEIVLYERKYRGSFVCCVKKCKNADMLRNRRFEVRRGSKIILLRPKTHVRGWALLTPTGIVENCGIYQGIWSSKKVEEYKLLMIRSCLSVASEAGIPNVKFRIPVENFILNKKLESFWPTLCCPMKVSVKYY